jgi:UDP-glucuronate decarboxylase
MATADAVTGPLNLGNPNEFSMHELAAMTIELTGSRSRVVQRPLPQDDPRQRQPDISKAHELISWTPRVALKDGLIRTIEYFEKLLVKHGAQELLA